MNKPKDKPAPESNYNFKKLVKALPELAKYVISSPSGIQTIDFGNPTAVKFLNKALLKTDFQVEYWDIPAGFLCPPVPSRLRYLQAMAELLAEDGLSEYIKCLDIGTGANLIYPLLGAKALKWAFVGSDISVEAIKNSQEIIAKNKLEKQIEVRLQANAPDIFRGVILPDERFSLSICNPPFFESDEAAQKISQQKAYRLGTAPERNFAGKNHELACPGGEVKFLDSIAYQSKFFGNQVLWFSSLVSQKEYLNGLYKVLKKNKVSEMRTLPIKVGNKISRVVAWTYFDKENRNSFKAD